MFYKKTLGQVVKDQGLFLVLGFFAHKLPHLTHILYYSQRDENIFVVSSEYKVIIIDRYFVQWGEYKWDQIDGLDFLPIILSVNFWVGYADCSIVYFYVCKLVFYGKENHET